jgi:arylsulfatase A-like enzyme
MTRLCLLAAAVLAAAPATAADPQPNVIVFLADDTGWSDIGAQGCKDIPTPNIDSVANNGVRCPSGYVSCPYCSPTRAGLLTGRYQTRYGHEFNEGANVDRTLFGLPLTEKTLADRLKPLGYQTWAVGKWHLGFNPERRPMRRGFDEFYGTLANTPFFHPMLVDSRKGPDPERVADDAYYTTDAYGDRAAELVRSAKGKPFFLYLPFNANHVPSQAPEKYLKRFPSITDKERQLYAAMMSAMDDAIGKVLAAVRDGGQDENTLIFFLSDNGGPMTKMGRNGSNNKPLKGQKGDTWEGGIRVPFLVQWKGKLPAGTVYPLPVISLDILPTAVIAAGGKVDPAWQIDGADLVPFLSGRNKAAPHEALFWRFGPQWAVRQGDWKLVRGFDYDTNPSNPTQPPVNEVKPTEAMLYNLKDDIGEARDVAAANPDKVKELQAAWDAWNKQQKDPLWIPVPAKKK